ncbi:MAG TPA: hypothetical protein VNP04_17460 [Alphaproteobacteria bacterium]|nr:hypothetical protein [Alphaproteobacteria bacterium]
MCKHTTIERRVQHFVYTPLELPSVIETEPTMVHQRRVLGRCTRPPSSHPVSEIT